MIKLNNRVYANGIDRSVKNSKHIKLNYCEINDIFGILVKLIKLKKCTIPWKFSKIISNFKQQTN